MKQGTGSCKITGVELGEIKVEFFATQVVPVAKFAYVDSEGRRFGFSHRNMWGGAVNAALETLKEAMEIEIAEDLFGGAEGSQPLVIEPTQEDGPPSL